ncbi:hypothetical protein ASPWEDRAFT_35397 [Aspergillus wentii DTO 134E9]|uniref:Uncharacterized protein n=1 Tax=Aspergillus wentii DTO 134E9 TaxID=1073089 RepID=A0A1L9S3Q2_ASPWE|nr:uncharacterized protein ASPWEDRAFT_35397 [Aspergillus wentii DTO 134E9]OJJ41789.1 hypothetical protein ASPWEDRAFT_35397 [Aspergillus wentii DTO 134E9]
MTGDPEFLVVHHFISLSQLYLWSIVTFIVFQITSISDSKSPTSSCFLVSDGDGSAQGPICVQWAHCRYDTSHCAWGLDIAPPTMLASEFDAHV